MKIIDFCNKRKTSADDDSDYYTDSPPVVYPMCATCSTDDFDAIMQPIMSGVDCDPWDIIGLDCPFCGNTYYFDLVEIEYEPTISSFIKILWDRFLIFCGIRSYCGDEDNDKV